jgi:3-dehydroquinate synthase
MKVSRAYQRNLLEGLSVACSGAEGRQIKQTVELGERSYPIYIERGILKNAADYMDLDRRVLVVTDTGVPAAYAETVAAQIKHPTVVRLEAGEGSKTAENFLLLLETMLKNGFTRTDAVLAVGGGVVGDLAGFAAACFMRGVDFYNIPTTLLAQVDSSVGGKTAIDMGGYKNAVGAFHQPRCVLIDPDLLKTLDARQFACGMAEIIKIAATLDPALFADLEAGAGADEARLPDIISRAIALKRRVVEEDEQEGGLRRVLNFGHTLGHGIESVAGLSALLHGECVSLGMLPLTAPALRPRLAALLRQYSLPTRFTGDLDGALAAVVHDKKMAGESIRYIYLTELGKFMFCSSSVEEFARTVKEALV